jgi:branched-chain amino acid transport system substrate-binding protein
MLKLRMLVAILLALSLVLLVAACGSSSSSSGGTEAGTTSEAEPAESETGETETTKAEGAGGEAATGEPISIGAICNCGSPEGTALAQWPTMIEAWTKYTNENGGINGHPVKVTLVDDGGDAAKSLAAAKKLVSEGVVAISDGTVLDGTWEKYAEEQGVPVLCGVVQPDCTTNADFFPQVSTTPALLYGFLSNALKAGSKKFGVIYCAEVAACKSYAELTKELLKNVLGEGEFVWSGSFAASEPDYTAQCLAAKEAGVEAWFPTHAPDVDERLMEDCRNQGFDPVVLATGGAPGNTTENYGGTSAIYSQSSLPIATAFEGTATPGAERFAAAMEQFASNVKVSELNDYTMPLWTGLEVFRIAGEGGELSPTSTTEDVKNALWGLKEETVGGLAPPLTYVKEKPTMINCWFHEGVDENGNQVAVSVEPECAPEADAKKLDELAGG